MESAKLAVFLLLFVAFIVIARRLFSSGTPADSPYLQPPYPQPPGGAQTDEKEPAAIGAELPFPIELPPVRQLDNGRYNRPYVLNYFFSNLDLRWGPENPRSFCDQLFVEFEAPETGARWTTEYTVATPFGLQVLLDQTGQNLCFDGTVIVVSRWDMAQILKTVLDDVMERYASPDPGDIAAPDNPSRYV